MDWLNSLFFDSDSIAHIVLLYSLVIAAGVLLGKIKFFGVSLGVTFVLFVGIVAGHFGFTGNMSVLNFVQDFGLILFVYFIGLQVGPSFFEAFKKGGVTMNLLAAGIVALNVVVMLVLYYLVFDTNDPNSLPMMVGVLCGAVTNTPGLGAATEALSQVFSEGTAPQIASGYACAYPLGVIGIIGSSVYSSITATMTEDLIFDEESKYVIEESEKLREQGANFIILSIHLGAADFSSNLIKSIVSSDIDLVLAGHNHREEVEEFYDNDFNVIPVLNAICNGEAFSKVEVQFDPKNQECEILNYDVYSFDDAEYISLEEDPEIYELYKSKYDVDDLKNEVIGQANGYFTSTSNLPVMAAQAMYEKVSEDFAQYDIKGSVHNQARANLESGEILYDDIYTSFPFENEILIVEADKDYIYDLASTSNRYFNIDFDVNDISDETFYFAGIDYVILKDFDTSECIKTGLFIRDIIVEYIKKVGTINSSDYY